MCVCVRVLIRRTHMYITASPVSIPPRSPRSCATQRPMRSSVEGLNQEIEKLVLVPGQPHSCRPESNHVRIRIEKKFKNYLKDESYFDLCPNMSCRYTEFTQFEYI